MGCWNSYLLHIKHAKRWDWIPCVRWIDKWRRFLFAELDCKIGRVELLNWANNLVLFAIYRVFCNWANVQEVWIEDAKIPNNRGKIVIFVVQTSSLFYTSLLTTGTDLALMKSSFILYFISEPITLQYHKHLHVRCFISSKISFPYVYSTLATSRNTITCSFHTH